MYSRVFQVAYLYVRYAHTPSRGVYMFRECIGCAKYIQRKRGYTAEKRQCVELWHFPAFGCGNGVTVCQRRAADRGDLLRSSSKPARYLLAILIARRSRSYTSTVYILQRSINDIVALKRRPSVPTTIFFFRRSVSLCFSRFRFAVLKRNLISPPRDVTGPHFHL